MRMISIRFTFLKVRNNVNLKLRNHLILQLGNNVDPELGNQMNLKLGNDVIFLAIYLRNNLAGGTLIL